jgi:hypothetical protein
MVLYRMTLYAAQETLKTSLVLNESGECHPHGVAGTDAGAQAAQINPTLKLASSSIRLAPQITTQI